MVDVCCNYAPYRHGSFNAVDRYSVHRLILQTKPPVLIIGEGNGTFSLALGALRQSMTEIVTTCLENNKQYYMARVLQTCLENHAKNNEIFVSDDIYPAKSTEFVGERYHGETFTEENWTRISGVDCQDVQTWMNIPQASFQNIFFQCPYTNAPGGTQGLLQSFMNTTNQVQAVGHYVFIGITSKFPYVDMYGHYFEMRTSERGTLGLMEIIPSVGSILNSSKLSLPLVIAIKEGGIFIKTLQIKWQSLSLKKPDLEMLPLPLLLPLLLNINSETLRKQVREW
jgi:hypothetical protein